MLITKKIRQRFLKYIKKKFPKSFHQIKTPLSFIFKYFDDRDFNRKSFKEFISEVNQSLNRKAINVTYANQFISLGKHLDRFIGAFQLQDYKYFYPNKKEAECLTVEELEELADTQIKYSRESLYLNYCYSTLIYLLSTTGCRIEEALNLDRSDLLLGSVSIQFDTLDKTKKRVVPITPWLFGSLRALNRTGYIFQSYRGNKLTASAVRNDLIRRAKKIKLDKRVNPEIIRQSYIEEMIRQKVPIQIVAEIIGHTELSATGKYLEENRAAIIPYIFFHPFFRKDLSFDLIKNRIKEFIEIFIDRNRIDVELTEEKRLLSIKLKEKI